ncbi:solute carrier family 23 protein, partial [Psychrobacter sp. SIMBA_152]
MAMGKSGDGGTQIIAYDSAIIISMFSLLVTLVFAVWGKGVFKLIPILAGVVAGYTLSLFMGIVQFE